MPLYTPDSGIRSPSPEELARPIVPQRKREKKMRIIETIRDYHNEPNPIRRSEPPPDYSPPTRSRSISPVSSPTTHYRSNPKKMYQKTRFASSSELSRPISTHTIETQTTPTKKNKVGAAITNSIRKLVDKIRSASVDKQTKSKSKSQSPRAKGSLSPLSKNKIQSAQQQKPQQPFNNVNNGSTYQQYNVIDNHIGPHSTQTSNQYNNRESSTGSNRRDRALDRKHSADSVNGMNKPKYYLGEDPYLSIYGKENKYDGSQRVQRYQSRRQRSDDVDVYNPNRYVLVHLQFFLSILFRFIVVVVEQFSFDVFILGKTTVCATFASNSQNPLSTLIFHGF